ncbi:acyl dehydratase [Rhizobium leguminosarum]|uniref:Acyl dehydratase n=1 Tax=Rhizobium leguminosarum TaxID=384 RepID=A0AAE2MN96_RHILE|nr:MULTISPECIES: MaoC family dehydratase [Rhizobium]MBB4292461.1 acyl dehydratase [Rhizobium leguminosarum]MBB4298699.1 acyl dehydratase [Rhizobium leguminosarum]MBB4310327.1 acyl dehydratase [Rhizobium leguminosarum]MBB4434589.1 acyl dehydratase [Rhizobium esperanzae]MBB4531485.1 acyl dehydratase [Rhizobium leguminosarum]
MTLSPQSILDFPVPQATHVVTARDAILYALSVGYGTNALEENALNYVYERDLVTAPTLANIVAHPGPWMQQTGVDWTRLVHSEHRLTIHRPVPLDVPLISRSRVLSVVDRGVEKGMFVSFERLIATANGDEPIATIVQTNACRGDGGCGSVGSAPEPLSKVPDREPDFEFNVDIPGNAALLYRLNGDLNPLHVDPQAAGRSGFDRPILHGLCSFGYAGYGIAAALDPDMATGLSAIAARFSAPIFPGETITLQIWRNDADIRFKGIVASRGVTILDNGMARLS